MPSGVKMPSGMKMPSEYLDTNGWSATQKIFSHSCRQLKGLLVRNVKCLILRGPVGARSETMTALFMVCNCRASDLVYTACLVLKCCCDGERLSAHYPLVSVAKVAHSEQNGTRNKHIQVSQ